MIEGDPSKRTPMVAACIPERFLTLRCIPIGINFVLPFAIFATRACIFALSIVDHNHAETLTLRDSVMRASWTVFHRAVAVHGEEASIALPAGVPHPATFFPFKVYPPGYPAPLWMLAHMADIERDEESESDVALV
ncbi:hypothetical protein B0H12DRAFT_427520 [Mycena haematopus]|nr:hypothetical protein B0H12DRAFT_427520 [Mycena haematopus]